MPPDTQRSRKISAVVGIGLSLLLLWFLARQIDMVRFRAALTHVNVPMLLLAIVVATLSFPLRIPRWRLLLPKSEERDLSTGSLWHAIAIGFTANTLIPLRVGEVVRAATLSRLARLSFATSFASLAVERAVDGLMVVALFGIGLVSTHLPPDIRLPNGDPVGPRLVQVGLIALVATLMALAAAWRPMATLRLIARVTPRRPSGEKFLHFVEQVLNGLGALRDPARAFPVLGWSLLLWTINAAGFWLGCIAFGIHIPFTAAFILQGMVVVGIAIPAAPGGLGPFEIMLVAGLALFGVEDSLASAYALAFHLTTAIPIVIFGIWSMRHVGGSFFPPPDTEVPDTSAP